VELLIYVVLGGAHADILTDGVQGFMMLLLAVVVIVLFVVGYGFDGGLAGLTEALREQDENLVRPLNPETPLYHSWWSLVAIVLAHMPLGLLPHLGNKLWALKDSQRQLQFVRLAFLFGLTMAMIAFAGLLARGLLGDALYAPGTNPNAALPMLFVEIFPTWLAALIGVGVLSAIMSTADGLVVSSSQIVANDLYRRTWVPYAMRRRGLKLDAQALDRRVLRISRIATVAVLLLCMSMAWAMLNVNIAIIVWIGNGGMMAAFAGPLVVGALWRGVTRQGAYAGLLTGFGTFAALYTGIPDPAWFEPGPLLDVASWLRGEGPNPYSCAALGEIVSVVTTVIVSKLTRPLPAEHVDGLFGTHQAN
jgi:Na+/proline symporter